MGRILLLLILLLLLFLLSLLLLLYSFAHTLSHLLSPTFSHLISYTLPHIPSQVPHIVKLETEEAYAYYSCRFLVHFFTPYIIHSSTHSITGTTHSETRD